MAELIPREFSLKFLDTLTKSYVAESSLKCNVSGRERLPLSGMAGGLPGITTHFGLIRHGSKEMTTLACHQDGIKLELRCVGQTHKDHGQLVNLKWRPA